MIVSSNVYGMSLIGVLCGNFTFSHVKIFELFVNLLFICLIYGLLSVIFSLLINHNYSYFISLGLFVLGELIKDGNSLSKLYFVFFPSINSSLDVSFEFGLFHLIFLFIVYFLVVIFCYVYKK